MYRTTLSLLVTVLFLLALTSKVGAAPKPGAKVDFKTLWALASRRSPTLRRAKLQIQRYEALMSGSKLLYAPTFSMSLYGAPAPKYECIMPQAWLASADTEGLSDKEFRERYCVGTNRDDSITLNLDGYAMKFQIKAVQPLYTFGKIRYAKAMARAGVSGSHANLKAKRRELQLLVRRAWYSRQSVRMLKVLIRDAEKVLAKAKEKAEEYEEDGKISPVDLIRLKLGENEIKRRKLSITKMERLSLAALGILAGKPVDITVEKLAPPRNMPPSVKVLLERALKRLPEVKLLNALRAAKVARVGLAKAAFLPDLGLMVRYTLKLSNSDDPKSVYLNDNLHGNSLAFGVGLNMKFDPAKMITDLRIARVEVKEVESKIAAAKDLLRMRLSKARQEVVYGIKQIKLLIRAVKLSRAWAVAINDQEKVGKPNPRELVKALTAYYKYKFALIEAKYQLQMAWAMLNHTTGK